MNKILFPAVSAALLLGAAAASAQSLPPYYSHEGSDLPWSINRLPPRDLNAYNPGQEQRDQTAARDSGNLNLSNGRTGSKPQANASSPAVAGRSAS